MSSGIVPEIMAKNSSSAFLGKETVNSGSWPPENFVHVLNLDSRSVPRKRSPRTTRLVPRIPDSNAPSQSFLTLLWSVAAIKFTELVRYKIEHFFESISDPIFLEMLIKLFIWTYFYDRWPERNGNEVANWTTVHPFSVSLPPPRSNDHVTRW